jgi:hypothetical protein
LIADVTKLRLEPKIHFFRNILGSKPHSTVVLNVPDGITKHQQQPVFIHLRILSFQPRYKIERAVYNCNRAEIFTEISQHNQVTVCQLDCYDAVLT